MNSINIDKINIKDIIPAEYNPRLISEEDYEKLQNSMSEFGVVDPIIINLNNNRIIGGHQRYDVLLDKHYEDNNFFDELYLMKLGDIGWVFTDTDLQIKSDDHEKALNLALNKISGEWDYGKLNPLLDDLSLKGFDLHLTGFNNLELHEINLKDDLSNFNESDFNKYVDDLQEKEAQKEEEKAEEDMVTCPECGCKF